MPLPRVGRETVDGEKNGGNLGAQSHQLRQGRCQSLTHIGRGAGSRTDADVGDEHAPCAVFTRADDRDGLANVWDGGQTARIGFKVRHIEHGMAGHTLARISSQNRGKESMKVSARLRDVLWMRSCARSVPGFIDLALIFSRAL